MSTALYKRSISYAALWTLTGNGDFQVRTAKVHEARFSFDTVAPPGS